jgi:hypothetical protein
VDSRQYLRVIFGAESVAEPGKPGMQLAPDVRPGKKSADAVSEVFAPTDRSAADHQFLHQCVFRPLWSLITQQSPPLPLHSDIKAFFR